MQMNVLASIVPTGTRDCRRQRAGRACRAARRCTSCCGLAAPSPGSAPNTSAPARCYRKSPGASEGGQPRHGLLRCVTRGRRTGNCSPFSGASPPGQATNEGTTDLRNRSRLRYNPFSFNRVPLVRPEKGTGGRGRSPKGSRSPAYHPSALPASLGMPKKTKRPAGVCREPRPGYLRTTRRLYAGSPQRDYNENGRAVPRRGPTGLNTVT
jgi:hypothetical protein